MRENVLEPLGPEASVLSHPGWYGTHDPLNTGVAGVHHQAHLYFHKHLWKHLEDQSFNP